VILHILSKKNLLILFCNKLHYGLKHMLARQCHKESSHTILEVIETIFIVILGYPQ